MATTNDIRNGTVIVENGQLWSVLEFQHVKPGKGGAFVRTKQRNISTGKVVDKTYNAGAKIETTNVDRRDYQFLYRDGNDFVFMDTSEYEQITVEGSVVGDAAKYLLENQDVTIAMHDGAVLYVDMPATVTLEIAYTEPGLQGDRSTGGTKPATVETGAEIQVPLFLETGTRIKIDTRTGEYTGRANG
ncbi:elongation factor P [Canibacter sp. lx-72]|uniref:elongation factor P n=1 Tax=Canibacter zhuwentaonis TaxID=2837491 RepID=UPI001BDC7254|nr:elongation factor P [Canibacter zhuwentaonis]MBT1035034.1 elongation factor P [Canibacter zhuwentaonis]